MEEIGIQEEIATEGKASHSFDPEKWPEELYDVTMDKEEAQALEQAEGDKKLGTLYKERRYLPCHYFDYICGSSTGA